MGSMGSSKGIIDIELTQFWELISKRFNFFGISFYFFALFIFLGSFFFSMEPNILTQEDFIFCIFNFVEHILTHTVIQEGDFLI